MGWKLVGRGCLTALQSFKAKENILHILFLRDEELLVGSVAQYVKSYAVIGGAAVLAFKLVVELALELV